MTNDSRAGPAQIAERLRGGGIDSGTGDVLTAGTATARLAAAGGGAGATAFVIGAPALHDEVTAAGLRLVSGEEGAAAEVVVVALHEGFSYSELRTATFALASGAKLFATNREPGLPMPDGIWPGTGAVLAAVEYASGATATLGGKPERHLFDMAREKIADGERVAIVGDGLASDIAGGANAGLATILVLTGNATGGQAAEAVPAPDHVIGSIAELA